MIWRVYYKRMGGHVHCRLFCGEREGALGKCGDLVMKLHEFTEFTRLRAVIAMDFRTEMEADGSPADGRVTFANTGGPR